MKKLFSLVFCLVALAAHSEDGYRLWLRYDKVANATLLQQYRSAVSGVYFPTPSPVLAAAKEELTNGLNGLLQKTMASQAGIAANSLVVGTPKSLPAIASMKLKGLQNLGAEGFVIQTTTSGGKKVTVITANEDAGVLYGVFHYLRLLQTGANINNLSIVSAPKLQRRILNHWDNLDRTVERGYAGFSLWDWHRLPGYIDPRYKDYARANASIGINGTVLTNVNANALVLTPAYLKKVAALADVFRPYGIRVYLTARFSAPVEIGGLKTADPLDPQVQQWWKDKTKEVYSYIPDFGGYLVKANSEGQPGPQNYGRNHADGANLLADAVAPHGGIVMWRAFVYSNETPEDRIKQAYSEFKPLDGSFRDNVLVQVKNGALDFQPREPFHPLFGAMPKTPMMMEFQMTQEYLGQATHLVYQGPLYKEILDADTYAKGKGSTVAKVIDGTLDNHRVSGIAGVTNIGNDRNWTGHLFGQSNWYLFGRLAWDHQLTAAAIADEWTRQTFSNNAAVVRPINNMLMSSHQTMVDYMTPLGLAHIMGYGHHYGPAPWWDKAPRADWNPVYFHKADKQGIGFDRTKSGSNALEQYAPELQQLWGNRTTVPNDLLLWFHHVGWKEQLNTGRTLWDELCYRYNKGVAEVRDMQKTWTTMKNQIDPERFEHVRMLLAVQEEEAVWWRDACLLYFQTFSGMPIPAQYEQPAKTLEYYKSLKFPYAPGNG
ncbi:alpha-glucuronidase family glycosyl hydrolase [Paracnuella aquatica]|uniref:alpha-glucuronidase family glycosyl hydrolase n=1 Tax=Paracnuella aquatica TaxID=2268757 RepID=UPI000DEF561E|nr:alpha-glucuronidase family glycosyl hydrolase [Paracnuella aquatica]RPD51948.1 alpha-glucuronidase [Paracnuella aquatica]